MMVAFDWQGMTSYQYSIVTSGVVEQLSSYKLIKSAE